MKPSKTFQTKIVLRQIKGGSMPGSLLILADTPCLVLPPKGGLPTHKSAECLGYDSALAADQDSVYVGFVRVEEAQSAIDEAYAAGVRDGVVGSVKEESAAKVALSIIDGYNAQDEEAIALEIGRAQLALLRWARDSEKAHGEAKRRSQKAHEHAQKFVNAEKKGG